MVNNYLLSITLLLACGLAYSARSDDFASPATISHEARQVLTLFSRAARNTPLPASTDLAGWKQVQAEVERKREAASAAVVKQYEPEIEPRQLGRVPVLDVKPHGWKASPRVLVYTHGGAYTMYSAKSRLMSAVPMAHDTGIRVIAVDYTLAPHAQWQAVTDQVIAVMQALVSEGHTLKDIAIYGESAGGGLAAGRTVSISLISNGTGPPPRGRFGVADVAGLISRRVIALLSLMLLAFAGNHSAASDKFPGVLLPWAAPLAATNLVARPDCDPDIPSKGIAYLSWTPAGSKGRQQRIAITIFPEGLEKREFNFSDPLPPTATNLVWKELRGQAIHYWQVLTLHKDGWVPSKTAKFEGPLCVSDQVKPPQKKKP